MVNLHDASKAQRERTMRAKEPSRLPGEGRDWRNPDGQKLGISKLGEMTYDVAVQVLGGAWKLRVVKLRL